MKKNKDHNERITIGWLTIPNEVVFNNDIKQLSKFLLGLILSFQYQSQCYSSNEWFANQFDVSIRTIETCVRELKEKGYIETVYSSRLNKRLILPADKKIWSAYSKIRSSNPRLDTNLNKADKKKLDKQEFDTIIKGYKKVTA